MWGAVLLGSIGASGLLLGAAVSLWLRPKHKLVGLTMGFGTGALISAIAYELVPEAVRSDIPVVLGGLQNSLFDGLRKQGLPFSF